MDALEHYAKSFEYSFNTEQYNRIVEEYTDTTLLFNHVDKKGFVIIETADKDEFSIKDIHLKPEYLYTEPTYVLNSIFIDIYKWYLAAGIVPKQITHYDNFDCQISHLDIHEDSSRLLWVQFSQSFAENQAKEELKKIEQWENLHALQLEEVPEKKRLEVERRARACRMRKEERFIIMAIELERKRAAAERYRTNIMNMYLFIETTLMNRRAVEDEIYSYRAKRSKMNN